MILDFVILRDGLPVFTMNFDPKKGLSHDQQKFTLISGFFSAIDTFVNSVEHLGEVSEIKMSSNTYFAFKKTKITGGFLLFILITDEETPRFYRRNIISEASGAFIDQYSQTLDDNWSGNIDIYRNFNKTFIPILQKYSDQDINGKTKFIMQSREMFEEVIPSNIHSLKPNFAFKSAPSQIASQLPSASEYEMEEEDQDENSNNRDGLKLKDYLQKINRGARDCDYQNNENTSPSQKNVYKGFEESEWDDDGNTQFVSSPATFENYFAQKNESSQPEIHQEQSNYESLSDHDISGRNISPRYERRALLKKIKQHYNQLDELYEQNLKQTRFTGRPNPIQHSYIHEINDAFFNAVETQFIHNSANVYQSHGFQANPNMNPDSAQNPLANQMNRVLKRTQRKKKNMMALNKERLMGISREKGKSNISATGRNLKSIPNSNISNINYRNNVFHIIPKRLPVDPGQFESILDNETLKVIYFVINGEKDIIDLSSYLNMNKQNILMACQELAKKGLIQFQR